MLTLTAGQKKHVSKVITVKRKELYGYAGGNSILADRIGVSSQLLSMWAHNKRTPNHKQLLLLAEVFEMSLEALCRLKPGKRRSMKKPNINDSVTIDPEEFRGSMLRICNITTELVDRQRQMLGGRISYKEHKNWQRRIKEYVNTM